MTLPAGTQIGRYVVQRKVAEGGMAEIFLASSFGPEGFEKQVIIKRIRSGLAGDPSFIKMFVSEARLVSRLNHSNIVQVFEFDRHDDTFYIAMEYVRGVSLAQAHARAREVGTGIPPIVVAQIAVDVARGLGFAHRLSEHGESLGLVHRDVTPQNILLSYEGAVKLTDFGIAKAGSRASTVGMLKGKFAYMSPEQSRGDPVDARTDLFALGITLWELLAGQQLFDADSDIAVLRAVQERAVTPPTELNPTTDPALSAIVMRCLERDRAERIQSAQELERALTRYVVSHAEHAEEIDVAAWMRSLFPAEAARTEATVARPTPAVGEVRAVTGPSSYGGRAAAGVAFSGSSPPPPILLSPATETSTAAVAATATGETPVLSSQRVWEESPTRRTMPSWWARNPLPIVLVALGAFLLVVVLLKNRRPAPVEAEPAVATASAKETSTAAPVTTPPESPAPEPAPKSTVPVAAPTTARRTASAGRAPAAETGTLELTVGPWGEVFIDGKSRGELVGSAKYELSQGDHQIDIKGAIHWGPKKITVKAHRTVAQSAWVE